MRIEPTGVLAQWLTEKGYSELLSGFDVDDDRLQRFAEEIEAAPAKWRHLSDEEKQAQAVWSAYFHPGWGRAVLQQKFALVDGVQEPPKAEPVAESKQIECKCAPAIQWPVDALRDWFRGAVILLLLSLLFAVAAKGQPAPAPVIIRPQNGGSTLATFAGGILNINASTGLTGAWNSTTKTFTLTNSYSLPSTVVQTNQSNTYSTGVQSFASATSLLLPTATSTTAGATWYNTVNGRFTWRDGVASANREALFLPSGTGILSSNGTTLTASNAVTTTGNSRLLNWQSNVAAVAGNGAYQSKFSYTLPGGTMGTGECIQVIFTITHPSGGNSVTPMVVFGATTLSYPTFTGRVQTHSAIICNDPGSSTAQRSFPTSNLGTGSNPPIASWQTPAENTANDITITGGATCNAADTCGGWSFLVSKI